MLQLCSFLLTVYRGGGINGSGGVAEHKSAQHNQHATSGRAEHRAGLGDQPGQYATLSKQCKTLESSDFYWGHAPSGPGKSYANYFYVIDANLLKKIGAWHNMYSQLKETFFLIYRCFRGFKLWSTEESFVAGHGACAFCFTHIAKTRRYPSHCQRVSLWQCPDNGGGINGQHTHSNG